MSISRESFLLIKLDVFLKYTELIYQMAFPPQFCRKCSQNTREKLPTVSSSSIYIKPHVVSMGLSLSLICFEEEIKGINSFWPCDVSHWPCDDSQHVISNSRTEIFRFRL